MRIIAIVNQKGGCGKTTTAVNLAGALAADGYAVLVVDMDPQAHASLALGVDPDALEENLYDVLADLESATPLESVIVPVAERLDLAPSSIVLSALEQRLAAERHDSRTERLTAAIESLPPLYDYLLIDCPPNVGLLTFNALRAAREVIVPLESSVFAIDGVQKLLETIGLLADRLGHDLSVRILATLYDGRTRFARQTLSEIRELFKDLCFDTVIRLNVKLREAARRGVPITRYAPRANGAIDYSTLAIEVAASPPLETALDGDEEETSLEPREVTVRFRDAGASDVRIAGDFNGWVPDKGVQSRLESDGGSRVWTKVLRLPPGTYQYRYVVDGEWQEDPENRESQPSPSGGRNSILIVR